MAKRAKQKQIATSSRRASKNAWLGIGVALVAVLGVGIAVFAGRSDQEPTQAAASPAGAAPHGAVLPVVDVYKDPTCGCCSKWVEHLQDHGFTVRTTDTTELAAVKASHHVPRRVQSCHTALVDGYVIEGHVPARDIRRLLDDRPAVAGVAVAGMPIGSPGMEVEGTKPQPYDVMAFDEAGSTRVFATYE